MKTDEKGAPAVTAWRVLGRARLPTASSDRETVSHAIEVTSPVAEGAEDLTWLALEPHTGRTHQLRVHCAAMGWPIVGDAIYGNAPRVGGPVLQLHAREVVVPLYKNREPIRVTAPVPTHMSERLKQGGWNEAAEDSPLRNGSRVSARP
jgi:tRNA pseudouridine32 synthase/23S rRNA pseudouridine746 synthase